MDKRTNKQQKKQVGVVNRLREIKKGTELIIEVGHPKEIDSIRSIAYRLNVMEPELGKRFSCKSDFRNRQITVTANPV